MTDGSSRPTTLFEALLPLWRWAVEGKDGRPITGKERKWLELEMEDAAGESLYSSGAVRCRVYRDSDGTPCVHTAWSYTIPAWSHAMSWPFFQGWQDTIEALMIEYEGGHLSVFGGFPEHLERARVRLDELQPHLPLFLDHMRNGPGLPDGTLVELIQDAAAAPVSPAPAGDTTCTRREPKLSRETRHASLADAACWFKMDVRTLQKCIRDGLYAARRVSDRRWQFDVDEVFAVNPDADCDAA